MTETNKKNIHSKLDQMMNEANSEVAVKKQSSDQETFDEVNTEAVNDPSDFESSSVEQAEIAEEAIENSFEDKKKVKIDFPYSEVLRAQAPKAFEIAENVAEKWVNDEKFEALGFSNPLAEIAASKTLEKAKEVEKKLEEKGVISMAKMGVQIAKFQAESILNKLKK